MNTETIAHAALAIMCILGGYGYYDMARDVESHRMQYLIHVMSFISLMLAGYQIRMFLEAVL